MHHHVEQRNKKYYKVLFLHTFSYLFAEGGKSSVFAQGREQRLLLSDKTGSKELGAGEGDHKSADQRSEVRRMEDLPLSPSRLC